MWQQIRDKLLPEKEGMWPLWLPSALLVLSALAGFYLQGDFIWKIIWIATLCIPLILAYEMTGQIKKRVQTKDLSEKELTRDVELWKSRFETLHEKIGGDKEVWEEEMDKLNQVVQDKKEEVDSLRVLIQVSHKETRKAEEQIAELETKQDNGEAVRLLEELNELRCTHHETELLLEKANHSLEGLRQRQTINESLHTKKASKQSISLKDLAGKF